MTNKKLSIPHSDQMIEGQHEIEQRLRDALRGAEQLQDPHAQGNELLTRSCRALISDAEFFCINKLSNLELSIGERSPFTEVAAVEDLAALQSYRVDVQNFLLQVKSQAGMLSRASQTKLWLRHNHRKLLQLAMLLLGTGLFCTLLFRLASAPGDSSHLNPPTVPEFAKHPRAGVLAVKQGDEQTVSSREVFEAYKEALVFAQDGSGGISRLGSTVVASSGSRVDVYGIAYAYSGALVTIWPGGVVFAERGAIVDNHGGEVTWTEPENWPLRYRK